MNSSLSISHSLSAIFPATAPALQITILRKILARVPVEALGGGKGDALAAQWKRGGRLAILRLSGIDAGRERRRQWQWQRRWRPQVEPQSSADDHDCDEFCVSVGINQN